MDSRILKQIADLPNLDKAQLLVIWSENFRHPPPLTLRKELMVPLIAFRIQEREMGGLSNSARRRLGEIAKSMRSEEGSRRETELALDNGTRLIRLWKGEAHEVRVLASGFEYRGKKFGSLSKIAREITGTRWSGPLFFGTRNTQR
jgi:Protein of unknown function (DUF2924)